MAKIGFVGLGAMGSRMAANLVAAGHEVVVWNRDPAKAKPFAERGVEVAKSPAQAARGAACVIAIVADDIAADEVTLGENGILAGIAADALLVDATTATPGGTARLAQATRAREAWHLDAPVLGSLAQAQNRELVFLVGGEPAAFARAEPILKQMGRIVRHIGPNGAGATLKLINNMISGTLTAAIGEAAAVARAAGLDLQVVGEVLNEGAAGSRLTRTKLPKIAAGDYTPLFQLALMEKDVRYFVALAEALGEPVPLASQAGNLFRAARRAGLGAFDSCALYRYQAGEVTGRA